MSASHLQRTFAREVGVSPRAYVAALRADRLKSHLRAGSTVSRATFDAGYGASSRAYEAATQQLGMTPGAYRRGGKGVDIRYTIAASSLGRVLVAATTRGVCAVTLGDDDATLEEALRLEYPGSSRTRVRGTRGDAQLREWVRAVSEYIEGSAQKIAVPLDVNGTPFQHRVWQALQSIPYGETRSYAQLAEAIHSPARGASGRECVRAESRLARHPLSPGRSRHRSTRRLSVGARAKGAPARTRARCWRAASARRSLSARSRQGSAARIRSTALHAVATSSEAIESPSQYETSLGVRHEPHWSCPRSSSSTVGALNADAAWVMLVSAVITRCVVPTRASASRRRGARIAKPAEAPPTRSTDARSCSVPITAMVALGSCTLRCAASAAQRSSGQRRTGAPEERLSSHLVPVVRVSRDALAHAFSAHARSSSLRKISG